MEVKLTTGVVVRMIDKKKRKERDSDQCKARHGYVGGQRVAQPAQNYV